jgi:hypothetical protein
MYRGAASEWRHELLIPDRNIQVADLLRFGALKEEEKRKTT